MLRTVKTFVRDDHTLIVDTTTGKRITKYIPHANVPTVNKRRAVGAVNSTPVNALNKAKNLAKASAQHALAGFKKAPTDVILERHKICLACDHIIKIDDDRLECAKCGCGIKGVDQSGEKFNKLAWAEQRCPVGKWPAIT